MNDAATAQPNQSAFKRLRGFDPRQYVTRNKWVLIGAPIGLPILIWLLTPVFGISQPDVIVRTTPFILTALAVALPARAGLINVGGEGQLLIGAAAAAGFAFAVKDALPLVAMLPLTLLIAAFGGMLWAGVAAFLKTAFNVNETISTLLMNYVAVLLLGYLVNGALKDPESSGFAIGAEVSESARLAHFGESQVHIGILFAMAATIGIWLLIEHSRWGFKAKVVGGNPEAARRGGIPVGKTVVTALLVGGAIAGLAGGVELAGTEVRIRSDMATGFGYIGFLCSWMVGHRTKWIPSAAVLLAAISVYGDNLQIEYNLPAATVYVLMSAIVLLVLAQRPMGLRKAAV